MSQASWIRLAKVESHWGLYHVLNPPAPLPSIAYWLRQRSVDPKLKIFLKALRSDHQLFQLLGLVGVTVEEVAAIVLFCNLTGGWFDKTIASFKKAPPPFQHTKNVRKLKLEHSVWNLFSLICNKEPKTPESRSIPITKRIMRLFGRNVTNQRLRRIAKIF